MNVSEKPGPAPNTSDTKRLEQSIITLNNVLRKEQRYIMDKVQDHRSRNGDLAIYH